MCGIFALLARQSINDEELKELLERIDRRGPDYCSPLVNHATNCANLCLMLKSSVLHLRGDVCQRQPIIDMNGNVLMFNGQIYKYSGELLDPKQSDTTFLANKLQTCHLAQQIAEIFTEIEGPFAFIFWHHKLKKLFYGRDLFGRKSLCGLMDSNLQPVIISSVAYEPLETTDLKWHEISCSGVHCIDYNNQPQAKKCTFLWDLDSIYPKTDNCEDLPHYAPGETQLKISLLEPLNNDLIVSCEINKSIKNEALKQFESLFKEAVSNRYKFNRPTCLDCRRRARENDTVIHNCQHAKVAVAFSGGIDSTLIAIALDKVVDKRESIDLVTVAFKPDSPDRGSVGSAFREIRKLSPDRKWRLVLSDIAVGELQTAREYFIRELILPCDTVFDDGIGCACWFIGRGLGRSMSSSVTDEWMQEHFEKFLAYNPSNSDYDSEVETVYVCPASMLFVGSSIDEQLGGYSSHRRAWSESGAEGLFQEVSFLMRRLSSRNLGRDDRVYCDHGRDLKLPFLDYQFVSFLNQQPLGLKMNLEEPLETGPKKILRKLALKWGLEKTGRRAKRAMQFGTRIANLEGTKERGNDVCSRLRQSIDDRSPIKKPLAQDDEFMDALQVLS